MKYKLLKITIIIIAILLLIISLIFTKPKLMGYLIVYDGYTNYNNKIISTYDEYKSFLDYLNGMNHHFRKNTIFLKRYNKFYFEKKSLAVVNVSLSSGMHSVKGVNKEINGDTLICNVLIDYGNYSVVTADMSGALILVEANKDTSKIEVNKKSYSK